MSSKVKGVILALSALGLVLAGAVPAFRFLDARFRDRFLIFKNKQDKLPDPGVPFESALSRRRARSPSNRR